MMGRSFTASFNSKKKKKTYDLDLFCYIISHYISHREHIKSIVNPSVPSTGVFS